MPSAVTPARRRRTQPAAKPRGRVSRGPTPAAGGYLAQSATPWASLLFVLPLLVLHEVGVAWFGTLPPTAEHRVAAFALMARLFDAVGATAPYLPAAAVIAVLLAWHLGTPEAVRPGGWRVRPGVLVRMAVESVLWAVPLVGVYYACSPGGVQFVPAGDPKLLVAMYLGAGVYEEAVFRLASFAVLSLLLVDMGKLRPAVAVPIMVSTAAGLFSVYHIWGGVDWAWQAFVFTGLRGVFYGIIFIERGFGVTVGAHTAYDLAVLVLMSMR
ncbi:MAG: CPBP family intramembrane glutamic endopeptidase [Phycisphaerae bacterium]